MDDALRQYIKREMIRDANYPLQDEEPLITSGLVDSFSLVQLALFIEEQYGVQIPDYELTADNMNTVNLIQAMIASKR